MTDHFDGEIGRHPAYMVTMVTVCFLGVLLNMLVIVGVCRFGRFKMAVDYFLTNLALSEILQCSVVFPFHLITVVNDRQDMFGDSIVCKIKMCTPLLIVMAAIFSIVVMALDRLRCIVYQKTMGRRTALTLVGLIWILSLMVSSPQLYEYDSYLKYIEELNITIQSCGSENIAEHFETIYAAIVFVVAYCVPLITITISYGRVLKLVWNNANNFLKRNGNRVAPEGLTSRTEQTILKRKMKLLKLLISITASFTILWTPYFILFALKEIMHLDDTAFHLQWPHVFGRILTALSTLINPITFIMFSDQFRKWLHGIFRCEILFRYIFPATKLTPRTENISRVGISASGNRPKIRLNQLETLTLVETTFTENERRTKSTGPESNTQMNSTVTAGEPRMNIARAKSNKHLVESESIEHIPRMEPNGIENQYGMKSNAIKNKKRLTSTGIGIVTRVLFTEMENLPGIKATGTKNKTRLESTLTKINPRLESTVAEDNPRLESTVTENYTRLESTVAEDDPRLESTEADDIPRLESTVAEDNPRLESTVAEDNPRLESAVAEDNPRLESTVAEDNPRLESTVTENYTRLESTVAEDNPRLESTVADDIPRLESTVAEDNPRLESAVAEDNPRLESTVAEDNPRLESAVAEDNQRLESTVAEDNPRLESTVAEDNPRLESTVAIKTTHDWNQR